MDSEGSSSGVPGSDNQDSNEPAPPGTLGMASNMGGSAPLRLNPKLMPSSKGVENAKKRLRAFSIQKKTPITPVQLAKPTASGSMATTVLIGKLSSVKTTPKVEDDTKKLPKPPKPGSTRRNFQDSYTDLQKRTLSEIEDMKRKMELVELGIPLGLICPSSNNEKAMPTKAMPPIKSFLDATKVDQIIREAKKAQAEGKEFKFDYQKLLPDYDNPFQRKKDDPVAQDKEKEDNTVKEEKYERHYTPKSDRDRSRDKRKSSRFDSFRRHSDHRKDDRDRYKEKRSEKNKDRSKESREYDKSGKSSDKIIDQEGKETDVNLNDYLVCDSWSLDNDEKTSSPHVEDKANKTTTPVRKDNRPTEIEPKNSSRKKDAKELYLKIVDSPKSMKKIEKLQPVIDSFKFEIDPNDDEVLDIFDDDSKQESYVKPKLIKSFDYNQDTNMSDSLADDNFLESVINEIKQENLSDDDSQDKGLVEYDSPLTDYAKGQGTPELDDSMRLNTSERSDYAESFRSTDSGCKSTESGYRSTESGYRSTESGHMRKENGHKSTENSHKGTESGNRSTESEHRSTETTHRSTESGQRSTDNQKSGDSKKKEFRMSVEKELEDSLEGKMMKATADSLDVWNFVLKICQPLLFRHDKSKCYKETLTTPSVWWAEKVAGCGCVRGRGVVTAELRAQRMALVDRVYGCDQISDSPPSKKRHWYPPSAQCLSENVTVLARSPRPATPVREDDLLLDREYQRFMQAVWPEGSEAPGTPRRAAGDDGSKKQKGEEKDKLRKRKRSSSTLSSTTDDDVVKKRKTKKKTFKKAKAKLAKRARQEKKNLKKLKEKQKKKKKKQTKVEKISDDEEIEVPKKKSKDKKIKKKQLKINKTQKKKKVKAKSSSSSSSYSSSSSDSDERKKKEERKAKKKEKKKRQEEAFDVNILKNIKTEKLTDDEKCQLTDQDFSPRRQQARRPEIINVKELQDDLVGVQIKKEAEEDEKVISVAAVKMDDFDLSNNYEFMDESRAECREEVQVEKMEFKEPQDVNRLTPQIRPAADETNVSQCSSQESLCSETDQHAPHQDQPYEKDESHLRPSSQNSNYSFNDVIASQTGMYSKGIEASVECDKFEYEQENYEIYEQLAMAYQSDVASNQVPLPVEEGAQRIETVVMQQRGEIKCDWRAGDAPAPRAGERRSRWGLKPSEVNIVLTGGSSEHFMCAEQPVYQIESIANRNDNSTGYDEAYMVTYGAMDRLQYGDCFAARDPRTAPPSRPRAGGAGGTPPARKGRRATLDDRIDQALRHTVLGDIAMEPESQDADKENIEKGILLTKPSGARGVKRVSFADGYTPGQDSDTEEPPMKKRKKSRRSGCAWPCPATHPDHVPLWDALPPPGPPPGDPPPPRGRRPPPLHFDPSMPPTGFMPPEPPPGLISFP